MIKAVAQLANGRPLLLLGLSADNVRLIRQDKAMHFGIAVDGVEVEVVIMYGETEQALVDDLKARGFDLPTPMADPSQTFPVDPPLMPDPVDLADVIDPQPKPAKDPAP